MNIQQKLGAFYTLLKKEILRFLRIWIQTILPPAMITCLYFFIFGHIIGDRIGEMAGYSYIDFIVPGLIMMTVITNSYGNVVASFFSAKFHGHVEELLISPMPYYIILLGYVGGGIARGIVVAVVVTIVSYFFTDLHIESWFISFSIVILTAFLFSLAGFINAVYAKTFDDISIVPTFVLTPLTYLGGIFYSVHLLPSFWQQASLFNPILYMVNGFRYGILGKSDINIFFSYVIIISFIVVLFLFALYLLKKGISIRT